MGKKVNKGFYSIRKDTCSVIESLFLSQTLISSVLETLKSVGSDMFSLICHKISLLHFSHRLGYKRSKFMEIKLKPVEIAVLKVLLEHSCQLSTTQVAPIANVSWNTAKKYLEKAHSFNWIA
jgi:hypothetical protein